MTSHMTAPTTDHGAPATTELEYHYVIYQEGGA